MIRGQPQRKLHPPRRRGEELHQGGVGAVVLQADGLQNTGKCHSHIWVHSALHGNIYAVTWMPPAEPRPFPVQTGSVPHRLFHSFCRTQGWTPSLDTQNV